MLKSLLAHLGYGLGSVLLGLGHAIRQVLRVFWRALMVCQHYTAKMLARAWQTYRPYLTLPLTVLAALYVVLGFLLPAGQSRLLGVPATPWLGYLPYLYVPDSFGLQGSAHRREHFLTLKIYRQDQSVLEGEFPGRNVRPFLRLQRWRQLGLMAAHPNQRQAQRVVITYLAKQIATQPLRLALFASHWQWNRNTLHHPFSPAPKLTAVSQKLGHFDFFSRQWIPQPPPSPPVKRNHR